MSSVQGTMTVLQGVLDTCERCERVADALTPEQFGSAGAMEQSIGSHLRHALDHVTCFLRGHEEGLIDYDARDRDQGIENDPAQFRSTMKETARALADLDEAQLNAPVRVRVTVSLGGAPVEIGSTLGRELAFLSSHTIHHLALVLHLCRDKGVELPEDMGLAFSTAAYRAAAQGA